MLILRKDWINLAQTRLNDLNSSDMLIFKTLKSNRSVHITKLNNHTYKVVEDGLNSMTYPNLNFKQLVTLLKKLDTLEFTQSNKLSVSIEKFNLYK